MGNDTDDRDATIARLREEHPLGRMVEAMLGDEARDVFSRCRKLLVAADAEAVDLRTQLAAATTERDKARAELLEWKRDGDRESAERGSEYTEPVDFVLGDLRRQLAEATTRAETAEKELGKALAERDRREEQVGDMAAAAGCEQEFTNLHDHLDCVGEEFAALTTRAETAEDERDEAREAAMDIGARNGGLARRAETAERSMERAENQRDEAVRHVDALLAQLELRHVCKPPRTCPRCDATKAAREFLGRGEFNRCFGGPAAPPPPVSEPLRTTIGVTAPCRLCERPTPYRFAIGFTASPAYVPCCGAFKCETAVKVEWNDGNAVKEAPPPEPIRSGPHIKPVVGMVVQLVRGGTGAVFTVDRTFVRRYEDETDDPALKWNPVSRPWNLGQLDIISQPSPAPVTAEVPPVCRGCIPPCGPCFEAYLVTKGIARAAKSVKVQPTAEPGSEKCECGCAKREHARCGGGGECWAFKDGRVCPCDLFRPTPDARKDGAK